MARVWIRKLLMTILSTGCSLLAALPAWAGEIWQGSGSIISGSGQGGIVGNLSVEIGNQSIHFIDGPSQGERASVRSAYNSSFGTNRGRWEFRRSGNDLVATFYATGGGRASQIVRYNLRLIRR